jgi:hypothetical protein
MIPVVGGGASIAGAVLGDVTSGRTVNVRVWSRSAFAITAEVNSRFRTFALRLGSSTRQQAGGLLRR